LVGKKTKTPREISVSIHVLSVD